MARSSAGEAGTLLEAMLTTFLPSHEDTSETDLKKYLADQNDQNDGFDDEKFDGFQTTESVDLPLEVLFTRDDSLACKNDATQDPAPIQNDDESVILGGEDIKRVKHCNFLQTRNKTYSKFMEEIMLVKCCSKKILQCLENTKLTLEQFIEIKDDPGFGRIHVTEAWVWILKEAIITASVTVKNDKKRKKVLNSMLIKLMTGAEQNFKQLLLESKNAAKTFEKVQQEFELLMSKAFQRFSNNLESSLAYEMRTSGYDFFFHRKDASKDSLAESVRDVVTEKINERAVSAGCSDIKSQHSLHVRCSIDGITLRTGKRGNSWLKFKKVDQDRDIQLFLNLFMKEMTGICAKTRESIEFANKLLEGQTHSSNQKSKSTDSIMQSIQKCQEILSRSPSKVNFFPKEEVIMLYTLKTTKAAFELMRPLLVEFALSTDLQFAIVREFTRQRKSVKNAGRNAMSNRFPANLNSQFELIIKHVNVNMDTILSRYPNVRDAKQLQEKLLQKYSQEKDVDDDDDNDNDGQSLPELDMLSIVKAKAPTDTLYKCPPRLFPAQSTHEMVEMFRDLIAKQRYVTNPNPAHYLFTGVEREYFALTKQLTADRVITRDILNLCSDPIQKFHQAACDLSSFKDKMLTQIVYATQKLIYAQSGSFDKKEPIAPMSMWIQVLCKILYVWDFHSLQRHLQVHFRDRNEITKERIARLEESFRNLAEFVKKYKEDLYQLQNFIETHHGFITWVRKSFSFNPPEEVISKWYVESQEDEQDLTEKNDALTNEITNNDPRLQLLFHDFDMSVVRTSPNEDYPVPLVTLNKCSDRVQVGLVTTLFTYIDEITSSAIVNLNCAQAIHEKYISLKPLKNAIQADKWLACLKHIHQLEDLVLALTFEQTRKDLKETVAYVGLLHDTISQFNKMFQTVQLHLEERGILKDDEVGPSSTQRKKAKKDATLEVAHHTHKKYLNEAMRLLKSSVGAMPNVFEIQAEGLAHSIISWVEIAEKDATVMASLHNHPYHNTNESSGFETEGGETDETSACPINFEQIMMLTTSGKSFFPDPSQFSSNLECWRTVCFKMLAAALDKFREMTTTKIIDTKVVLNTPQLSQTSVHEPSSSVKLSSPHSVGYTEVLCYLLYFITTQLDSRDKSLISSSDRILLKRKFATAENIVKKFTKELDVTESEIVNSLSLSMASVEHKRLPHYLPVLPLDNDYLKSHDLEEVGSVASMPATIPKKESRECEKQNDISKTSSSVEGMPNEEACIELQWHSSDSQNVVCKRCLQDDPSFQFSNLQVSCQLRIIHLLMDELILEFTKATAILKDAKADLICAKKLLEKTWKGIGKDMKRRRVPGSGIVVLLKLYRHQVATAVVNLKAIRKTTREVKYLLFKSTQNTSMWANAKSSVPQQNKIICPKNLDHLSLRVELNAPLQSGQVWLENDAEKMAEQVERASGVLSTEISPKENKNFLQVKEAAQVTSSASIINLENSTDNKLSTDDASAGARLPGALVKASTKEEGNNNANNTFLNAASSIQQSILSELRQSVVILKLPNCCVHASSEEEETIQEITNLTGVLIALVAVTINIRSFKEVMPQDRNRIYKRISLAQQKISRIRDNDGVLNSISAELIKIKKSVQTLDANFRSKFSYDGEYPPVKEILTTPLKPTYGITPMEFVEELAASVNGHVWTVASGIPDVGTVLKNNKTLESHAIVNIPLTSKLELLLSIVIHLEKIISHVQTNLERSKKDLTCAKLLLKAKGKAIPEKSNARRLFGMLWKMEDAIMSKRDIDDHLNSFASIFTACTKAEENLHQITDMLQRANDILQQITLYIHLKFKLEPTMGIGSEALMRAAQNWHSVDLFTGATNVSNGLLGKIGKNYQKMEHSQAKYKAAWENKALELELHFDQFCKRNITAVDIPIVFAPVSTEYDEDYDEN